MPFLFPAIAAAICDVGVLYLSHHPPQHDDDTSRRVFQSRYLYPLAVIRILLLLIPLPYHSYHGKALRCSVLYQLFYGMTLIVVVFHALSLIMIDPSSLSSVFTSLSSSTTTTSITTTTTISNNNLQHDLVTRNLWWSLILTVLSTLSHVALFFHVRSTAPSDAEFQRPKVLLYYVKGKHDEVEETEREGLLGSERIVIKQSNGNNSFGSGLVLSANGSLGSPASSNRVQEISNKLVMELHSSLNNAKKEWSKRLEEYHFRGNDHHHHHHNSLNNGSNTADSLLLKHPPAPFRVMLELFAGEDVITNGRMDAVYDQDQGVALMFFIPQLLSFLLHGAYELSPQLEDWILEVCRRNVFFAHKCYWFLRAWALESSNITTTEGQRPNTTPTATRLRKSSSLASFENFDDGSMDGNNSNAIGGHKLLPEERAVIEELMRRIMQCGEQPAKILHFGQDSVSSTSDDGSEMDGQRTSPSALMMAAECGAIPIDPLTGNPSAKHFECLAATRRFGFLPMDTSLSIHDSVSNNGRNNDTSYFDSTPVFLDALITIADSLFKVPREKRLQDFQRQLDLLEVEALPSNEIYIPLQNPHHRVWRIIANESIAISTKERVPCIVCLEVVDYTPREVPKSRNVRELLELRSSEISVNGTISINERELIVNWRSAQRDPRRRETALEKLTHSMKQGIGKIPKQMTSSMKEQIKRLKSAKTEMEDFWSVRVPDSFSFDHDDDTMGQICAQLHTMEPMPTTDIERGNDGEDMIENEDSRNSFAPVVPVQPGSPRHTLSSRGTMGQWTSPSPKPNELRASNEFATDELTVPTLKHRSYQTVQTGRRISNRSLLGLIGPTSNNSAETISPAAEDLAGTPSKPPTKPPPVVFKENWKEKEDRLRATSAFGRNPGWRLLPVLVKPNDDLRQEQLASQLIQRMALILARERVPVWLCPYEILAIEGSGGIIEAIPDTISIASLKKNDPEYSDLKGFFHSYFVDSEMLSDAKANFCESLAAYSIVCFLLQIKDRHNGNILLDNRGHLIHIDFGFFFLSSPGKNTGFESAPFKLTREFVELLDGPDSHLFGVFRTLCYRTFIALRKHCQEVLLTVEMLKTGNEDLGCFRGRPDDAIRELRHRFRLDLNDRACLEYINALVDESLENWRTNWYDRYQRYCVGVL
ncbi:phosphatidylinositol 3- and 4-kinase [Nitzschia inconspicua]|uniref:1-phosphatidylinositol 4-kinase n=1 Tax=Nitzschia inconspicua TaxID=303405 RepID=A0A9K3PNS6_9STRA|nr:phosphatidylinositol 3- and 4-kinase [Nitzschia inconspicua]